MKHRIIVVGLCVGVWLCGTVQGQTIVTNLLVKETLRQGTNSIAAGIRSTALGEGTIADGDFSCAVGDTTMATGTASHAEGTLTIAGGESSHAEGEGTEALALNSHAGGAYARVRTQDTNAFIHAAGTYTNIKETISPDTAHFDRLVTLEPALDNSNAVLSRVENDQRYLAIQGGNLVGDVDMGDWSFQNVSGINGSGQGINLQAGESVGTNVWVNWNADMLDGQHADDFVQKSGDAMEGNLTVSSLTLDGVARTNWYRSFVENGEFDPPPQATGSNAIAFGLGGQAFGHYSVIGGGVSNLADETYSTVAGGYGNYANGYGAVVAGGIENTAKYYSFVGGGSYNSATGNSVVAGGWFNAGHRYSFIGGGGHNSATGAASVVAGGWDNRAWAKGATVAGGYFNYALGEYSFAAGLRARANHSGTFVWADPSSASEFSSVTSNEFAVRAAGGVRIAGTGLSTDGRFCATNSGKTSEFFAVQSGSFIGDASGMSNYPAVEFNDLYVNISGDAMTGPLSVPSLTNVSSLYMGSDAMIYACDALIVYDLDGYQSMDMSYRSLHGNWTANSNLSVNGEVSASLFTGDGSGLTNLPVSSGHASSYQVTAGTSSAEDANSMIKLDGNGNIEIIGGETGIAEDEMHIKMTWDVDGDDPSDPGIDLKPMLGASLKGLGQGSDRWWTDGRFCATNSGKTSEFFAVQSGSFIGDGSGLVNLPTNASDARYINASGDTMTGPLWLSHGGGNLTICDSYIMYEGDDVIDFYNRDFPDSWTIGSLTTTGRIAASRIMSSGTYLSIYGSENQARVIDVWGGSNETGTVEIYGNIMCDGGAGSAFSYDHSSGNLSLGYDLSVDGQASIGSSTNETNLVVSGWAQIDYVPPQGGISMGIYTNR